MSRTSTPISGAMPVAQILAHLSSRGCKDVTPQLDLPKIALTPTSAGGQADVYKGKLLDGRDVAVKILRITIPSNCDREEEKKLQRVAHELYIWTKCKHPNILELIGMAIFHNNLAMISPWISNSNLSWFIDQNPEVDRFDLCAQVAEAVAYMHLCHVVHGDIKCGNVLVSQDNVVKLMDFGSSAHTREYTLKFEVSSGQPAFSLRWAAPELLSIDDEAVPQPTFEADVYALGMTFLEIITGEVPYHEVSRDAGVFSRIAQYRLPKRPEDHMRTGDAQADSLWLLMQDTWKKEPCNRPTAGVVCDRINALGTPNQLLQDSGTVGGTSVTSIRRGVSPNATTPCLIMPSDLSPNLSSILLTDEQPSPPQAGTDPDFSTTSPVFLEDDIFYDAFEYQTLDEPTLFSTPETSTRTECEGTQKWAPSYTKAAPIRATGSKTPMTPTSLAARRGTSKPTGTSASSGRIQIPPSIARLQAELAASTLPQPRRVPQKKAVLIGLNYDRFGNYSPLRHATEDARRFAAALTKLGYSEENMRVVTDELGQPFASSEYITQCMDWLVGGAGEGDHLLFVFSGHCEPPKQDRPEPCLVAADLMTIPQSTFQQHLVAKVPAGTELTVVLDCCNAAGMVKPKYCAGRMGYKHEITQTSESEMISESQEPPSPLARGAPSLPQFGSLHGLKGVDQPRVTSIKASQAPSVAPRKLPRRPGSVVAAPPWPVGFAPGQASVPIRPLVLSAAKLTSRAQRQQLIVAAPIERCQVDCAQAGQAVVWAGEKAFETSGEVKNGIITNAICSTLEKSLNGINATKSQIWDTVAVSANEENTRRCARDANKPSPSLNFKFVY